MRLRMANATSAMRTTSSDLLTAQFEMIGPHLAKQYLDKGANFREPSAAHVKSLVEQMKRGRWKENGYPLRFRTDGKLIDGQHRLLAVIETGMTFRFLVVSNVPFDAETTIDEGGKTGMQVRTLAEHLHNRGVEDGTAMASILRNVYRHHNGLQTDRSGKITASISQFLELFLKHRDKFQDALEAAEISSIVPKSASGLIYFLAPSNSSSCEEDAQHGIIWEDTVRAFLS